MRCSLRIISALVVAVLCVLALTATAISGPIDDPDTHYFILLWQKKYPLNYLWTGDNVCGWEGVACDTVKQQVTLLLPSAGLKGGIPTWGSKKDFTPANVNVVSINLMKNALTGSFPAHYGQLVKLQELYLMNTTLSGTIPQSWNNLANLAIVDVSNTKACGNLPAWDSTSMPSLQYMNFQGNTGMRGTIPASLATFGTVSFNTSGAHFCGCVPTAFRTSLAMYFQITTDQYDAAQTTCGTLNACTATDLTCKSLPSAVAAPALALGSLVAVVVSLAAVLVG